MLAYGPCPLAWPKSAGLWLLPAGLWSLPVRSCAREAQAVKSAEVGEDVVVMNDEGASAWPGHFFQLLRANSRTRETDKLT
eukprot:6208926-Pleurochrysis_carterae.AAC.5